MYPKTKIVATVGPASNTREKLAKLAEAGVSVFRLNFSHGGHEEHAAVARLIRQIAEDMNRPLGILGDLSGPKLRLGEVAGGERFVNAGEQIRLTSGVDADGETRFQVNFSGAHELIEAGKPVILDDGMLRLVAERIEGQDVVCRVQNSAPIRPHKGVNLPGTPLPIPALTDKDREDLDFALSLPVDFVALSFVRNAADLDLAREQIGQSGKRPLLIAKIEKSEAVDNLEAILDRADGAMVARGDLGVEIPIQTVPSVQRRVLRGCNERGKPVITATQMLNTMISEPMPTRAEVTDIYNAILQGTDAVMLSGETAVGKYPVEAVTTMNEIAVEAGKDMAWSWHWEWRDPHQANWNRGLAEAICEAAVMMAQRLKLKAIVCPTVGGSTARMLARFRPKCPVIALSTRRETIQQLVLSWGVRGIMLRHEWNNEALLGEGSAIIHNAIKSARLEGILEPGDQVVVVAGLPMARSGLTNALRVLEVRDDSF